MGDFFMNKEKYNKQVDEWQERGTFGQNEGARDAGVFGRIGTFLVGDHSKKSMTQLDALRKMGDAVEDLAKEKIIGKAIFTYYPLEIPFFTSN